MARSSTSFKPGQVANPKGRPPGPILPTIILKNAMLLAASRAGGADGDEGLVNYLQSVATTHPAAFMSVLGRVIPLEVEARGDGHITIEIIKRFDDEPQLKTIEHKSNGKHINGNGHKDPAAE